MLEIENTKYYDMKETADMFGVSKMTIRRYMNQGKLKGATKIANKVYFSDQAIKEYLKNQVVKPNGAKY